MHPYLLHLGRFVVPTYGALAALGLMAALGLSQRTAKRVGLDAERVWDASLFAMLAAFVLSRLVLVLTNLSSFLAAPLLLLTLPSLSATGVWLTLLCTVIYLRVQRLPLLCVLDAWAPCATLVWAFLAAAHLADGSDPGMVTASPVNWVTSIPSPSGLTHLYPVALYAALAALGTTALLLATLRRALPAGRTAALALLVSGLAEFLLTFLRQPSFEDSALPSGMAAMLDPIQWLALLLCFAGGVIYLLGPQSVPAPERAADAL
ncbi:MAG: prolipoprotein diacylglyceryl transferase [Acidobacteriota bacterium]|nr:prolipoprotein diacylglyceryl transferase [Acidobacteriota bacterium]